MPPKFDKKKTVAFSVVHRSHEDSRYHDADAGENVLVANNSHELSKEQKRDQREQRRMKKQAMADAALEERKEYLEGRAAAGLGPSKTAENDELAAKKDTLKKIIQFDGNQAEQEFKSQGRRDNEGEAAMYGIFYDDSKYDYMKHLKPIGETKDAVFISKRDQEKKKNGKKNAGLMLNAEYAQRNNIEMLKDVMASETTVQRNFDSEKNIPDSLAGFNPDMDPGLREVLEALEDEEYVTDAEDNENEDLFGELLASGEADSEDEDEYGGEDDYYYDEDEDFDGQVSDFGGEGEGEDYDDFDRDTVKSAAAPSLPTNGNSAEPVIRMRPTKEGYEKPIDAPQLPTVSDEQHKAAGLPDLEDMSIPEVDEEFEQKPDDATEQDWEKAFKNFKIDQAKARTDAGFAARDQNGNVNEFLESEAGDGLGALSVVTSMTRKTNMTNKKWRKSKGKMIDRIGRGGLNAANSDALTEITGLSMSSSANFRNKHLTMLDDRFDTIEEEYFNDIEDRDLNDDTVIKYGMPKKNKLRKQAHQQRQEFDMGKERPDFESIMDDFLDNHIVEGRKFYKK